MKKFVSFFKWMMLGLISMLILLTLSGWLYIKINQGTKEAAYVAYLRQNQVGLSITSGNTFAKAFDADFYQNRIYLLGESHGYQVPQELDLQLVKHLSQQINCRNYLAEVDAGQAYYLNQYLQTGNEANLKKVFRFWLTSQWGNKNFYKKIVAIRQYNQTLPAGKRIRFVGIDRLQDISLNQQYLQELVNQLPDSQNLNNRFTNLLQNATGNPAYLAKQALVILEQFKSEDSNEFNHNNLELRHLLQNFTYLNIKDRDRVMVKNFLALEKAHGWEKEPFYGLWGYSHTLQAPLASGSRFAALLKDAKNINNNQVVSINLAYVNSEMMLPQGGAFSPPDGKTNLANSNGPLAFQEGIKDLTTATTHPITLFKLAAPGSPYLTSNRLTKIKTVLGSDFIPVGGQVTANYFQYMILVNGSKAVEPLVL